MWRDAERFLAKCLGPSELVGLRPYLQPLGRRTSLMELHGLSPTDANHSAPPRNTGRIVRLLIKCFKLGAMSVPEALETTIRILLMFSIVLAHRRGTVARAPQPARERLLTTPGHLWPSLPTPLNSNGMKWRGKFEWDLLERGIWDLGELGNLEFEF